MESNFIIEQIDIILNTNKELTHQQIEALLEAKNKLESKMTFENVIEIIKLLESILLFYHATVKT